ncbi:MAG: CvpA family protein, partial [Chlorobi bacterium]|nr:CvpA family protein [Chlorobiota bacterium]
DLILGIFLLWGTIQGFRHGLIIEAASLAALFLGIWGAIHFSDITAGFLVEQFNLTTKHLFIIAFAVTFIAIVILVHFLARALDKLVKAIALGWLNRLAGIIFGAVKMAFILSIVLVILNNIDRRKPFLPKDQIRESFLYTPLSGFVPAIFPFLDIRNLEKQSPKTIGPVTL